MIEGGAWFSKLGARSVNEDRCAYWWLDGMFYAAVADGLGGMGGGDQASNQAMVVLKARVQGPATSAADLAGHLLESHHELQRLQQQDPAVRHMATTLTVIGVKGDELLAAHCGDTRLFLVRGDEVRQLSEDHSEAQRLFHEGRLSGKELFDYPRRHILESALGIPGEPLVQRIHCPLQAGDWLVLATDGAHGKLHHRDLLDIARSSRNPAQFRDACRSLVEAREPRDNYTMVVARVGGDGLLERLKASLRWRGSGGNLDMTASDD